MKPPPCSPNKQVIRSDRKKNTYHCHEAQDRTWAATLRGTLELRMNCVLKLWTERAKMTADQWAVHVPALKRAASQANHCQNLSWQTTHNNLVSMMLWDQGTVVSELIDALPVCLACFAVSSWNKEGQKKRHLKQTNCSNFSGALRAPGFF